MKRRRKTKTATATSGFITPKEAEEMMTGQLCAWDSCGASFQGPLPKDWRNLLVWWSPEVKDATLFQVVTSGFCDRDAVLYPEHFRELESKLIDLMRWASGPVSGQA